MLSEAISIVLFELQMHLHWKYKVNWCNSTAVQIREKTSRASVKQKKSRSFCGFWNLTDGIDETATDTLFSQDAPSEEEEITTGGREDWRALFTYQCAVYRSCRKRPCTSSKPGWWPRWTGRVEGERERSFWENFSKMQEVAATAMKHMRDLWPRSEPRSALSSLFRSPGSAEVMGTHGGPAGTRALRDLPPPLGDGVFFCRVIDGQVSGWPHDRKIRPKNRR